ncbi:MAG TPA: ABC transporter permease [Candidatus Solibacter sp.]|nr:ABC transporter permease [Candidatus Solibacter sp.]
MHLGQNLKFAARMLRRNPALAASAILVTALGIGATAAMFSAADGILLRPLPFPHAEALVNVWESAPQRDLPQMSAAAGNYFDWRAQSKTMASLGAWQQATFNLAARGTEPERFMGALCDGGFFQVLNLQPALGRVFTDDETQPGKDGVVVLSWSVWQQRFGGDRSVIGRDLDINFRRRMVIGVMPAGFDYPLQATMWSPIAPDAAARARRDLHNYRVIGRMKDGVPLSKARSEFRTIAAALEKQNPMFNQGESAELIPMLDDLVKTIRPALVVLIGAVLAVLLIACANVANLLLAKAAGRRREIAIRSSLGAGRASVMGQLLTESVMLAAIGGAFGLLVAYGALQGLIALAPANTPRLDEVALNWRVAGAALILAMGTGVLFGLAPAWYCSRIDVSTMLKEGARGVTQRSRLRSALVVSQVAIALVLLAGAGLLIRSFYEVLHVDTGFNPEHLMTMRIAPAPAKYRSHPELQRQLARNILAKVGAIPGVRTAAISTDVPLLGNPTFIMRFEGRPPVLVSQAPLAGYFAVTPGFFDAMGMRLVRGRLLTERDNENAPLAAVVNEALVRRYFPNQDPMGKRLEIAWDDPPRWREIVGIVKDMRTVGLDQETPVQAFGAYYQVPTLLGGTAAPISILARTEHDPAAVSQPMHAAILDVDRSQPVFAMQPMTEVVSKSIAQRRLALTLLAFFATSALLLAAIGVYGVMSFVVSQGTNEIGIRMALGAQAGRVAMEVQWRGLMLVLIGLALGVATALPLTQYLGTMLFHTSPRDPGILTGSAAMLVVVSLIASWLPARRASRIDPAIALRNE